MSLLTKRSLEGYLQIDHRAAPGVSKDLLHANGVNGPAVAEGKQFEAPTIACAHCAVVVIINPNRVRARGYCPKCDHYVCDPCDEARRGADYVHRSFKEIADLVRSGQFTVSGSLHAPILTPTTTKGILSHG